MDQLSRYRGCLLAGAVGDALGYQVEFDPLYEILQEHGPRGVRTMSPIISDDTQMTLFTAEGMLTAKEKGLPVAECVYQSYLNWLHTQRSGGPGAYAAESRLMREKRLFALRAPGNTCLSALAGGRMGRVDAPINQSKGCGGVMRTAPCGLLRLMDCADAEDAYALQGAAAAAITHSHAMGWVPAAMLADMVHMICLEDGRSLEDIVRCSMRRMLRLFGPDVASADGCEDGSGEGLVRLEELLAFSSLMRRAVMLAGRDIPDTEAIAALGQGWVGDEALAIAVYCVLKHRDSVEDCLSAAVTHSGDSDSTGAIAGNLIGAYLGEEAIPARWLEEVELHGLTADLAQRLYHAANE